MLELMDTAEHSADSKERVIPEVQAVRMGSVKRLPPHFTEETDLFLWLTCFEMYATKAEIPERWWTKELLPLLAEGPFRLVPGGFGELQGGDAVSTSTARSRG